MSHQAGSIEKGVVAPELIKERQNIDFNQEEMHMIMYPDSNHREFIAKIEKDQEMYPELRNTHKYYEWTDQEKQENWMLKLKKLYEVDKGFYFHKIAELDGSRWFWQYNFFGNSPISLHLTMF